MLDPCDLCPLVPKGLDVPSDLRSCVECPYFRSFGEYADAAAKARDRPGT